MEDRPLHISITAGTIIKAVVIVAVCYLLYTLRDLVLVVLTAIVIASALEPAVRAMVRRRMPRILAVMLIYAVLISGIIAVFYYFIPFVANDLSLFLSSLPQYIDQLTHSSAFNQYGSIIGISDKTAGGDLLNGTLNVLTLNKYFIDPLGAMAAVFGGVFSFLLIIVFSFYFAVSDTGVDDFLRIITPKQHQPYIASLWRRSQHKIGLWMQGQLLLGVIMGILVFLGLMIFGVPHAPVLAVMTAIFEIVPVFGIIVAGTVSTGLAFAAGGVGLALATIALYVISSQFETHLIYPLVVTRVVGIPPLLVILALIVGGELFGFLGIILSVPVAATIRELARDYESGRLSAQAGTVES